jgi:hypothetical protein
MRPGPQDYFPAQQVWDRVYERCPGIDGPLAEGTLNDLQARDLIDMQYAGPEAETPIWVVRITPAGREDLHTMREANHTRRIALLGVASGGIGAIAGVLALVIG